MKVLLPIDVLHPHKAYVAELERILPIKDADIKLLYVAEGSSGFEKLLAATGKTVTELDEQLKSRALKVLDEVVEVLKPKAKSVERQVLEGNPQAVIEQIVLAENYDVTVINAEHNEFQDQRPLGSTASNVVKHGSGTIVILRPKKLTPKPFGKVLVALDGSDQALNALRVFIQQFDAVGRKLEFLLLNVVSIVGIWKFVSPVEFIASVEDNLNMAGEAILADGEKLLSEFGLMPKELFIRTGDIANEVIKAANDTDADLILVGAQGKTAVQHLLLGSVSYKLSQHVSIPLVVVK
jgi:nucleotide-binding universal stress UspA family protein